MLEKKYDVSLNMLRILVTLCRVKSASKAAAELRISQSAVSKYIKRLNDTTGKSLFVRTRDGLEPTSHCLRLRDMAQEILSLCGDFVHLSQSNFNPEKEAASFKIGIAGQKAQSIFEILSLRTLKAFPNIHMDIFYLKEWEVSDLLREGSGDIYMGTLPADLPKELEVQRLSDITLRIVCSNKSPFFKKGCVSREGFVKTPSIKRTVAGSSSFLDVKLKSVGALQETLITVPDTDAVKSLLRETPYLFLANEQDIELMCAKDSSLKMLNHDFELPSIPWYAIWDRKNNSNPSHRWLRDYIDQNFGGKDAAR